MTVKCESLEELQPGMVTVVGVPSDANSSYLTGPAEAPGHIRRVYYSGASNSCAENGIDLSLAPQFYDAGDLQLDDGSNVLPQIEAGITAILEKEVRVLSLGGDHAVTFPIVKAYAKKYGRLNILHLDAHPDLYHEFEGNPNSHACPFARIMEANLADRLIQIGIRTMNEHQRSQVKRFGVEVIEAATWLSESESHELLTTLADPVYLSLDLDVLDPAFAPGVSHHEPGGLSTRDVLEIVQSIPGAIVGADIVELNPKRDVTGITAAAAAKFLKEIAAQML